MEHTQAVRTYLELNSSIDNPKSVRAIAESLSIAEEAVGLAIHTLLKDNLIKAHQHGSFEGLQYYILSA